MNLLAASYKRHRFPSQIITHAVWLYFQFPLSLRLFEEMLLERGIVVSRNDTSMGEEVRARICTSLATHDLRQNHPAASARRVSLSPGRLYASHPTIKPSPAGPQSGALLHRERPP
jgi:hypothetical protein